MKLNSFSSGCLATLAIVVGTALFYHGCHDKVIDNTERETETVYDTIPVFIDVPVPRDSMVIRYSTVTVPVYDTIRTHSTDTLFQTAPLSFYRSLRKSIKTPLMKHG